MLKRLLDWIDRTGIPLELVLILAIWVTVFPYSQALNNPNERTRVLQARAIVEQDQLSIAEVYQDERKRWRARDLYGAEHRYDPKRGFVLVNDTALVCQDTTLEPPACAGLVYPAKAPGTAILGVPALALADAAGFIDAGPAGEPRATWVLRYGACVPLMLLALWAFGWLLRMAGQPMRFTRRAVLAAGLGTTAFSYGIMFVGHGLASGTLILGVAALVKARELSGRSGHLVALLGGLATAASVLLEYHAAIAILPIGLWVLADAQRRRLIPGFAIGSGLMLGLFAALHNAMFLSPVKTGHFYLMSAHNRESQSTGFLGISGFTPEALAAHLFDGYMGLVSFMPWLLVGALLGVPMLLRNKQPTRLPRGAGWALAAIPLLYLLFVSSLGKFRMMNGWSIGPRYLLPAILPLSLCAAVAWGRLEQRRFVLGRAFAGLVVASVVVVGAMTAAFPSPPNSVRSPFGEFALPLLADGWGVRHLGLYFDVGLAPLWGLLGLAAAWIVGGRGPGSVSWRKWAAGTAMALVVAVVAVGVLERRGDTPTTELEEARGWAVTVLEGEAPDGGGVFFPDRPQELANGASD